MMILHAPGTTAFISNGLGTLSEATVATVTEERNGEFELAFSYPVSGRHFADIVDDAVIVCKPSPHRNPEPFVVYSISKPIGGICTIRVRHISYALSKIPVQPFAADNVNDAIDGIAENAVIPCPFSFSTDKAAVAHFAVKVPSSVRSILGGSEGSLLDVYGGEWLFHGFTAELKQSRGADRGFEIRYGKNLIDLKQEQNCANVITGIYPYWVSGEEDAQIVQLPERYVSIDGTQDDQRIVPVDFSENFEDAPTEDQLRSAATAYISANAIGVPAVSLTVKFQDLAKTEEYKNIALLEQVDLCDTVRVLFPTLGVSAAAK